MKNIGVTHVDCDSHISRLFIMPNLNDKFSTFVLDSKIYIYIFVCACEYSLFLVITIVLGHPITRKV